MPGAPKMKRPRALGASCFAGGFTQGIKQHFDVEAVLEEDGYGLETHRLNHPEIPVHVGLKKWPLDDWAPATPGDELDLVFGNPPCAAWSTAGNRVGFGRDKWRDDPRVNCTRRHFGLLETLRPKIWVTESVTNAFNAGRELIDAMTLRALDLGYSVVYLLHDSAWHNVPQHRKRFFMICHCVDLSFPTPNWAPPRSAAEALNELGDTGKPYLEKRFEVLLPHLKPGEKLRDCWERLNPQPWALNEAGQVKGRPSTMIGRLTLDQPCHTYVGHAVGHPHQPRFLSVEECAALCGFPPEYRFVPNNASAHALVARGVCPPVAEWLGRNLAASLDFASTSSLSPTVTLIDYRKPPGVIQTLPRPKEPTVSYRETEESPPDPRAPATPPSSVPPRDGVAGATFDEYGPDLTRWRPRSIDPMDEYGPDVTKMVLSRRELDPLEEYGAPIVLPTPAAPPIVARKLSPSRSRPLGGTGSGARIRELIMAGEKGPEEIVATILREFVGRKTTVADVYWNYNQLKKSGIEPPLWRGRTSSPPGPGGRSLPTKRPAAASSVEAPLREVSPPSAPFRDGKPRALLTGCTAVQVGSQKTQLQIITAQAAWARLLEDLGYAVDWRAVTPGEDLKNYAVVCAALQKGNSIASAHYYGALWALDTRADAIALVDDWQTHTVQQGFETFARSRERAFRLAKQPMDEKLKDRLWTFQQMLSAEPLKSNWPWPVVAPIFRGGDTSLLKVPARVTGLDPTAYTKSYEVVPVDAKNRQKRWVQASLLEKPLPALGWPVLQFGNPDKGKGGAGPAGPNAQPRVPEPELMKYYAENWGVLSPPHPHGGSGWWRVRYLMSADAGAILSASRAEASVLGEAYIDASEPAAIERYELSDLVGIAAAQAETLTKIMMTKEELRDAWSDLIRSRVADGRAA